MHCVHIPGWRGKSPRRHKYLEPNAGLDDTFKEGMGGGGAPLGGTSAAAGKHLSNSNTVTATDKQQASEADVPQPSSRWFSVDIGSQHSTFCISMTLLFISPPSILHYNNYHYFSGILPLIPVPPQILPSSTPPLPAVIPAAFTLTPSLRPSSPPAAAASRTWLLSPRFRTACPWLWLGLFSYRQMFTILANLRPRAAKLADHQRGVPSASASPPTFYIFMRR